MRPFLFGSGFGALLHQRRLVPLHISAVQSPAGVLVFSGPSGAGKSTLAAALEKYNDWPVICDDMAVLDLSGEPALRSGVRRKKLWRDAVEELGLTELTICRDFSRADKFHLDISAGATLAASPVTYFFDLGWAETLTLRELSPSELLPVSRTPS